jgi:hypothetical protein
MRHRLGAHDTGKLGHIGQAFYLPSNRFEAAHYHGEQVVEVVSNPAGKLPYCLKLLSLMQRDFCLCPARHLFRDTVFKRGI